MLTLNSVEIRIVLGWCERAESSPFPQEQAVIRRLKQNPAGNGMIFSRKELGVIMHWAEMETRGHYGTEKYLLEMEAVLIEKIENYLNQ